ncbi:hypothetical protein AVEN_269820-1 [Araneus ventricosus]|uniref:Uncharacterized protein n=1 Tax=Araneus ventricosus TaxID=182803 RepID=A0A4Y2MPA3_ARAVE|nr:hypothetical protein AVEN_30846-1 [Araneus ventricosus]GBN28520.1 hypothetical protein AVEN_199193-1 [Araneus ventricosus]GBN48460.1 hypothetical protein AVEN_27039-1 [Araneus ventricosus]GBN48484.1 hypothetical protein AVEN_269820-1 [Araneus ventricosus]
MFFHTISNAVGTHPILKSIPLVMLHNVVNSVDSLSDSCAPEWRTTHWNIKLDIHGETAPHKWHGSTPHHSNFQPIHLGGSYMEAPCKPHNRLLLSSRAIASAPSCLAFPRELHSPSPPIGLHLVQSTKTKNR